jgi:hypothetical protein
MGDSIGTLKKSQADFRISLQYPPPYAYFLRSKVLQMNIYQGDGPHRLPPASMAFCTVLRVSSKLSIRMILFSAKQMFSVHADLRLGWLQRFRAPIADAVPWIVCRCRPRLRICGDSFSRIRWSQFSMGYPSACHVVSRGRSFECQPAMKQEARESAPSRNFV